MIKILITIGGYLPGKRYGGPVTSVSNFVSLLSDVYDIYIITSDHELGERTRYTNITDGWNVVGCAKVKYLSDKQMKNKKVVKSIIQEIKPDVIYHNGLYDYRFTLPMIGLSKQKGIPPIIFVPRGDLGPVYPERKKLLKKLYVLFVRISLNKKRVLFQATSIDEQKDIVRRLRTNIGNVMLIENIPTFPSKNIEIIQKKVGELKLLYFARIHPTKNLETALLSLNGIEGNVEFNIFGGIESNDYWKKCETIINGYPENIKVCYYGVISHDSVYELYNNHHALFFPTRNKENYGHTIVESIIAERPVVISNQSPWNDIVDYKAGWVYAGDDVKNFHETIQYLVNMDNYEYQLMIKNVKDYKNEKFSKVKIKNMYQEMIKRALDKK